MQLRRNPHFPQDHFTNNKTAGLLSDSLSNPSPSRHGPKGPTWSVRLGKGCSLTQTQTQEKMKLSLSNFHNAGDELNVPVSARAGTSDVVGAFANTNTRVPAESAAPTNVVPAPPTMPGKAGSQPASPAHTPRSSSEFHPYKLL